MKPLPAKSLLKLKTNIRRHYLLENHSIHTTDTIGEARDLAYTLMTKTQDWSFLRFLILHDPSILQLVNTYRLADQYVHLGYSPLRTSFTRIIHVQNKEPISADLVEGHMGVWLHGSFISYD